MKTKEKLYKITNIDTEKGHITFQVEYNGKVYEETKGDIPLHDIPVYENVTTFQYEADQKTLKLDENQQPIVASIEEVLVSTIPVRENIDAQLSAYVEALIAGWKKEEGDHPPVVDDLSDLIEK